MAETGEAPRKSRTWLFVREISVQQGNLCLYGCLPPCTGKKPRGASLPVWLCLRQIPGREEEEGTREPWDPLSTALDPPQAVVGGQGPEKLPGFDPRGRVDFPRGDRHSQKLGDLHGTR